MNSLPSSEILEQAALEIMRSTDFVGYVACGCVLLTFCMQTMIPLRIVALISNIAFISYASLAKLFPILVLHCLLAVINIASLSKALSASGMARSSGAAAATGKEVAGKLLHHNKSREGRS